MGKGNELHFHRNLRFEANELFQNGAGHLHPGIRSSQKNHALERIEHGSPDFQRLLHRHEDFLGFLHARSLGNEEKLDSGRFQFVSFLRRVGGGEHGGFRNRNNERIRGRFQQMQRRVIGGRFHIEANLDRRRVDQVAVEHQHVAEFLGNALVKRLDVATQVKRAGAWERLQVPGLAEQHGLVKVTRGDGAFEFDRWLGSCGGFRIRVRFGFARLRPQEIERLVRNRGLWRQWFRWSLGEAGGERNGSEDENPQSHNR